MNRHKLLIAMTVVAVGASAGCAPPVTAQRALSSEQIGTDYARLSGYMQGWGGKSYQEDVPADIRHSVILDEAVLTRVGDGETCFEATVRTGSSYDEPIAQLSPTCVTDGRAESEAVALEETLTIVDYSFSGHENIVVAEGVAVGEYLGLQLSKPAEKTYRVIERRASLCCPATPQSRVGLKVTNERMGVNNDHVVEFIWDLR